MSRRYSFGFHPSVAISFYFVHCCEEVGRWDVNFCEEVGRVQRKIGTRKKGATKKSFHRTAHPTWYSALASIASVKATANGRCDGIICCFNCFLSFICCIWENSIQTIVTGHSKVEGRELVWKLLSFDLSSFGTFPVKIGTLIGNGSPEDDEVSPSQAIPRGTKSSLTICWCDIRFQNKGAMKNSRRNELFANLISFAARKILKNFQTNLVATLVAPFLWRHDFYMGRRPKRRRKCHRRERCRKYWICLLTFSVA
jgi:hypothetical protein